MSSNFVYLLKYYAEFLSVAHSSQTLSGSKNYYFSKKKKKLLRIALSKVYQNAFKENASHKCPSSKKAVTASICLI